MIIRNLLIFDDVLTLRRVLLRAFSLQLTISTKAACVARMMLLTVMPGTVACTSCTWSYLSWDTELAVYEKIGIGSVHHRYKDINDTMQDLFH